MYVVSITSTSVLYFAPGIRYFCFELLAIHTIKAGFTLLRKMQFRMKDAHEFFLNSVLLDLKGLVQLDDNTDSFKIFLTNERNANESKKTSTKRVLIKSKCYTKKNYWRIKNKKKTFSRWTHSWQTMSRTMSIDTNLNKISCAK